MILKVCNQTIDLTSIGDCKKFVRCSNNILYTFECPKGLLFDNNLRVFIIFKNIFHNSFNSYE